MKPEILERLKAAAANKRSLGGPARIGLGSALQKGIHAIVDASPISPAMKKKIKSCVGCGRRVARLDRAVPDLAKPFGDK